MFFCTALTSVKCLVVSDLLLLVWVRGRQTYPLHPRLFHLDVAARKVIIALLLNLSKFDLQHLVVLSVLGCISIKKSLLSHKLVLDSVVVRVKPVIRVTRD